MDKLYFDGDGNWILSRRCETCKLRFKCFTTNTSNRPKALSGVNFEIAKCCIRCRNGQFRYGRGPDDEKITIESANMYLRVGTCKLHKVLVHQFSCCQDFVQKKSDNLTYEVNYQISKELAHITHNYAMPRYCIIDDKNMSGGNDELGKDDIK